jgi:carbonic anhydrase
MKRSMRQGVVLIAVVAFLVAPAAVFAKSEAKKPSPDQSVEMLKQGNERFVSGKSAHPHADAARLAQSGKENQADHAYATVLSCSDSRVPPELIFDAGVMDIFVVRVAGNVCNVDEIGSIEYGLAHVNTPVLVVLGHTQCGAVTAVTQAIEGHGHALERNIPPLVSGIEPAVRRAQHDHPEAKGAALIPYATEENIWQAVEDLFMKSPATRNLVKKGTVKVTAAMYDVGNGKVTWLPQKTVDSILKRVESAPGRAINPMADEKH